MYKVQQHMNGTVHVYDRSTGRLAMIIKGDNKENGISKNEPLSSKPDSKMGQLLSVNNFSFPSLKDKYLPSVTLPKINYCLEDGKDRRKPAATTEVPQSVASDLEFASPQMARVEEEEVEEEPTDKTSFLRLFALKPADSPLPTPRPPIHSRRLVAADRDSPVPSSDAEESCSVNRREINEVDLTSRLGQIVLRQAKSGNIWVRDCALNVGRYEKYCLVSSRRFGNWEIVPRDCNGNCIYLVTYQPIPTNNHKYLFNRKQRVERLRIIETGLNQRARRLKRLCRKVSVSLVRLTKAEIAKWTARRTFTTTQSHLLNLIKKPPGLPQFGACIDGTIVIEINDSSDEDDVKVSPKPKQTTCINNGFRTTDPHTASPNLSNALAPHSPGVTISSGGRLLSFSNLFPKSQFASSTAYAPTGPKRCLKTYSRGGFNQRHVAPSSSALHSHLNRDRSTYGPACSKRPAGNPHPYMNGSGPKIVRFAPITNGRTEDSDSSDSSDSDIVFLGCVPGESRVNGSSAVPSQRPTKVNAGSNTQTTTTTTTTTTGLSRFVVTDFCQTDLGGASPLIRRDQEKPSSRSPVKVVPQILVFPLGQAGWPNGGANSARVGKAMPGTNGERNTAKAYAFQPKRPLGLSTVPESASVTNGDLMLSGGATCLALGVDDCSSVSDATLEKMVSQLIGQAISHEIASLNMKSFHQENGVHLIYTFTCHMCSSEEMFTVNAMKKISWHMGNFHGGLGNTTLVSNVESVSSREIAISVQAFGAGP